MLQKLCKRIQHCCAPLRRLRNKRNVGGFWLKSLTGFKLCAAIDNNVQQGVQTDATRNIQQCWELLVNNLASVCTQPKSPEERKSAKFGQAACLDEDSSGTDADADLPVEANPPPPEPKQDKAKKKWSRKRQRTLEEYGRPFVSKL